MAIQRALLLIADIGGYTRFMNIHRFSLTHAQDIVGQLLESIIDAAEPAFTVAKLEGDAVFLYCLLPDTTSKTAASLTSRVRSMRLSFTTRQQLLEVDQVCNCDACTKVSDLKLKFVAHQGEIAFQKVKRFSELAGMDVIVLHRLLKNSVPVPEYVLMTQAVAEHLDAELRTFALPIEENLEGVGPTQLQYLDLEELGKVDLPALRPSFWRRWLAWAALTVRGVPYFLGLKKPCVGFRHLEEATGGLLPPGHD
jgi:hypothetical protein